MVFKNNFVVVVKCNGKILREQGEFVTLPFGSEYSILLKNLESRKAVVDISVDGKDVLSGKRLIVQPNSELELKGFKKDGIVTNKFKFIKKTEEISDYRGDRVDDGMIRVEVTYEKHVVNFVEYKTTYINDWPYWYYPHIWQAGTGNAHVTDSNVTVSPHAYTLTNSCGDVSCNFVSDSYTTPKQDEGITVKGSEVRQKFVPATTKTLESTSYVIILRLRGVSGKGIKISKPITVRTKITCETCGKKNKSIIKYCPNCGTHM